MQQQPHSPDPWPRSQSADIDTHSVAIKFNYRAKPKIFYLENTEACHDVCLTLSQLIEETALHDGGGNGTLPPLRSKSTSDANEYWDAHTPAPTHVDTDLDDDEELYVAPGWVRSSLDACGASDSADFVYSRVCNGWCCRNKPLEALLFGVLMPLALAGYWLRDTTEIEEETMMAFPGEDPHGVEQWLEASCLLRSLELAPRQIYHHGKFQDAKNVEYQEGSLWRLEPVWNTTVTLLDPLPASWRRLGWADNYVATAHTYVVEDDRPHCDGQVLDSLAEAQAACADKSWIPPRFWDLARPAFHPASRVNGSGGGFAQCWVERKDHTHVYLDVAEPLYFYSDLLAVAACFGVALTFAICIAREHREMVVTWMHRARNPFDAGVGPSEPDVVDGAQPPRGPARAQTAPSVMTSPKGMGSNDFRQWGHELREMTREMI